MAFLIISDLFDLTSSFDIVFFLYCIIDVYAIQATIVDIGGILLSITCTELYINVRKRYAISGKNI